MIAQAPNALDDYDTVEINTTLEVAAPGVLDNDISRNNSTLNIISFVVNGRSYNAGETATTFAGNITLNEDGSYVIVPRTGYTGSVPPIRYIVSNGTNTDVSFLFLTVERITNLLEINSVSSCNQGYTSNGDYKIIYSLVFSNTSTARDYHENNILKGVNFALNLDEVYGNGCVVRIENNFSSHFETDDFVGNPYPINFTNTVFNPDFLDGTSNQIFNSGLSLYPRQQVLIQFCLVVDPFCGGRPNPTSSGSGVNFDALFTGSSDRGNDTENLLLTDFHTPETTIAAGFYIPVTQPEVNADGTFDYNNSVVITNEGTATANSVNYNMGLQGFIDNGVTFQSLEVNQVSGPEVTINLNYNGISESLLLMPNNSIPPGETVILEVGALTNPVSSRDDIFFSQPFISQTQGGIDGFDEAFSRNVYSYVLWSDTNGNHLDRYYPIFSESETASSESQCTCSTSFMSFSFPSSSSTRNEIEILNTAPNGIKEHEEVKFSLTIRNTSSIIELDNLQLSNSLNTSCGGRIVSQTLPTIVSSNATKDPILNSNFNGVIDTNIFNGTSGLLNANQSITIEFTVVFNEDCINTNTASFSATNPLNERVSSNDSVQLNIFSNLDNDAISNTEDIDDDNDTIPDIDEYNGVNPLGDDDSDLIPNYRDIDFGLDANSDGIVDFFDFDNDGVPNHFDLDSDNDGILDIVEAGNGVLDTDNSGQTNTDVGINGLENSIETSDSFFASINYNIPNTDTRGNADFLDIDADDDGIVDNIEAQATFNYTAPNEVVSNFGIDSAYPKGLNIIDTEFDGVPDYIDVNSDNDIRNDNIEGWDTNDDGIAETIFSNTDDDNDGLDDAYDNSIGSINPTNNQIPSDFPNLDNVDNPERDWREIIAIFVLISNITEIEGENFTFSISLVKKNDNSIFIESTFPITINFSTSNGSEAANEFNIGTAPFDFEPVNTTFTIDPLTTSTTFTVTSLEDNIYELDEFFTLTGRITSNNTINNVITNIGTILDNDSPPSITMNDSEEEEGTDLIHTISITNPSSTPIEINVSTSNRTAISTEDYDAFSDILSINGTVDPNNPNLEISFSIPTLLDNLNELDTETINVSGVVTSTNVSTQDLSKLATIVDIDPFPVLGISNETTVEGGELSFSIALLNDNKELMRNYLPIDIQLETQDETALFTDDYNSISEIITIPAFESSTKTKVFTLDDKLNEPRETFLLSGTTLTSNSTDASTSFGTGFIDDDDYPNLFSPNNDGKSDTFKILGLENYPNFKLQIIDRWGTEVYNYNNNGSLNPVWWDGKLKGRQVPEGVYYYTLDFNDQITKPKKGFVQLIR
jgi:gliding motility-associated-like protein